MRPNLKGGAAIAAAVGVLFGLIGSGLTTSAQAQYLGTAAFFGVLGGSTVTNTGTSVIQGNVGVWPGGAITGFPPGTVLPPGTIHAGDAVAQQAQSDLTVAYNALQGLPSQVDLTGQDLGGLTLGPAVYSFVTSAQLTGILTLDGQGNSAAQWVFQIGSTLTTASNSAVLLINGANGNNVYWAVGSSATLGTNTMFAGNIVALASITLNTGASITCGRALARNGAVTLDSNVITLCVANGNGDVGDITDDDLGGGGVAGSQQSAFGASSLFGSFMLSQATQWGDGQSQGPPQSQRPGSLKDSPADAGPADTAWISSYQPTTRRAWASGFGGRASLDGTTSTGSSGLDRRTFGVASGLDFQIDNTSLVGIAVGYTDSTFTVSERLTRGTVEGAHVGLYGVQRLGPFYLAGTTEYAHFSNTTSRDINWVVAEQASAKFSSDALSARLEAGYRRSFDVHTVTPFVGLGVAHLRTDGFTEESTGLLGLTFDSNSVTSVTSSVGIQLNTRIALPDGGLLTPFVRIAWIHEFNPARSVDSFLTMSPAASFSLQATPAASDLAKINAGVKLDLSERLALFAYFEGDFSDRVQAYAGHGGLRISW
jgi:outer membrane autotransporter protein